MLYTKDMLIGDLLDRHPHLADVFTQAGMHCLDCPASRGESIAEACAVHQIDCDAFLSHLNQYEF